MDIYSLSRVISTNYIPPNLSNLSINPPLHHPPSIPSTSSSSLSLPLSLPLNINRGGWQRPKDSSASTQYASSDVDKDGKKGSSKEGSKDDRGGGGGGGGGGDSDLYAILGCSKSSSPHDITRAYRKKCVIHHPDKTNGDRREFDRISKAYEVLGDQGRKKMYDKYGLRSLDPNFNPGLGGLNSGMFSGMSGFTSQDDIFRAFFNHQSRNAPPPRARDVRYNLDVKLKDLYCGCVKNVQIAKRTPHGLSELKTVKVEIKRGTRGNEKIRIEGMIDHIPNASPGDVVFVVNEVGDERFKRSGSDLATTVRATMGESMTGFRKSITHLDGRSVRVMYGKGVRDGEVLRIDNEGMPKGDGGFGRLYVVVEVDVREELTVKQKRKIRKIIEPDWSPDEGEDVEEFGALEECNKEEFGDDDGIFDEDEEDDPFQGSFFGQNPNHFFYQGNGFGPRNPDSNVQCSQM